MKEIPSAEEYIKTFSGGKFNIKRNGDFIYTQSGNITFKECELYMQAFAIIHVKAALEAAAEKAIAGKEGAFAIHWNRSDLIVDKESILTAYPETNIK